MNDLNSIIDKLEQKEIEDFLIYAQVKLANLEDATYSDNLKGIAKYSQEIYEMADKLHISPISILAKEIALKASLKRDSDYSKLFDDLRESIYMFDQTFVSQNELLTC